MRINPAHYAAIQRAVDTAAADRQPWDDFDVLDGAAITAVFQDFSIDNILKAVKKNIGLDILIVTVIFLTLKKKKII